VFRVLTSSRAISLQTVAMDIVKVAGKMGIKSTWDTRVVPSSELRSNGDSALIVMAVDPLVATPWFLLARDCAKGRVNSAFYGTIEGKVNTKYVHGWMRDVDFIANSEYTQNKLLEAGLNVVGVVPHGVDLDAIAQAKRSRSLGLGYMEKLGLNPSKHVVVTTVANSHPRKGLAFYDKVVELVGGKDGSVKFLVITEDKGLSYFKKRSNLVVTTDFGKLHRITLLSIIASSHILALPSLAEGFGLPVLEAMALGTPAVHAELPPLMGFSTGFTVPVRDVAYFDRSEVGPSGIVYEQHLYDAGEFAEVVLQVVDMLRSKKEAVVDWRVKSYERVLQYSIYAVYSKLLRLMGFMFDEIPFQAPNPVDLNVVPPVPPPAPPITEVVGEIVEEAREEGELGVLGEVVVTGDLVEELEKTFGKSRGVKLLKYPGGDWNIRKPLLELISKAPCKSFVEVFGGSGLMTMLVPRDKFKAIIYNDKDELLVNLFKVVKERSEELQKKLLLIPFSRSIFEEFKESIESGEIHKLDPVEKAARTYYVIMNSMFGGGHSFAVEASRSYARESLRKVLSLTEMAKRLLDVAIENKDFRDVIRVYDRDYTLFYCDPPHLDVGKTKRSRYYHFSFTEQDMRDLLELLSGIKGKFILKLPEDHLQFEFIRNWVDRHKFNIKVIEHVKSFHKVIGGSRPRFKTVLIYNYEA